MGTPILLFLAIVGVMHTRFQHRDKHRVSFVTGLVLREIKRLFETVTIAAPVDIIALCRLLTLGFCGLEVCRYFATDGLLPLGHGITPPFGCPARRKAQCGALLSGRLRRAHSPATSALTDRPRPGALRRPDLDAAGRTTPRHCLGLASSSHARPRPQPCDRRRPTGHDRPGAPRPRQAARAAPARLAPALARLGLRWPRKRGHPSRRLSGRSAHGPWPCADRQAVRFATGRGDATRAATVSGI